MGVDVLAVIESHRDRWGDLDGAGRALEAARLYALRNPHPAVNAAVRTQAFNLRDADHSLRSAGRLPVIRRERRAALAKVTGATDGR